MAKPSRGVLFVLAALVLAAAILLIAHFTRGDHKTAPAMRPPETTASGAAAPTDPGATDTTSDARAPKRRVTDHRAALLAAIASARDRNSHSAAPTRTPSPGTPSAANAGGSETPTTLDLEDKTGDTSEWSKRVLGTINQLLGQCYDLGLAEDSKLEGTVTIRFKLVGEPGVGGLLESVEIVDADTTVTQQTLRDCLTQQLYALELDPPPDGVTVERQVSLKVP